MHTKPKLLSLSILALNHLQFALFLLEIDNNHDGTELQEVVPEEHEAEDGGEPDNESGFKVKERSILQAKLTKLAIQIGYAGRLKKMTCSINERKNTKLFFLSFPRHDHRHSHCSCSLREIFYRRIRSTVMEKETSFSR